MIPIGRLTASTLLLAVALLTSACPNDTGMPGMAPPPDDYVPSEDDPGDPRARQDVCGNGLDEDRDGRPDDQCGCELGQTQPCYPLGEFAEQGACAMGIQDCVEGFEFPDWGECSGAVLPTGEICGNGIDEDCDGQDLGCRPPPGEDDPDVDDAEGPDGHPLPDEEGGVDDPDPDGNGDDAADDGVDDDGGDPEPEGPLVSEDQFVYGEDQVVREVDFVWAVDQSDSMGDEIALVRAKINDFATHLADSGLDARMTMVAARRNDEDHHEICVAPPLAGDNCANSDRFQQIDVHVDSEDALEKIRDNIGAIEGFQRDESLRVFIVVTDDDSDMSAWEFDAFLLNRPGYDDYIFDGFVGIGDFCDDIEDEGDDYIMLAALSGGRAQHLCGDWDLSLDQFTDDALARSASYELEAEPDPATLEVSVDRGAGWEVLDESLWDFEAPRTIRLMPEAGLARGNFLRVRYEPAG